MSRSDGDAGDRGTAVDRRGVLQALGSVGVLGAGAGLAGAKPPGGLAGDAPAQTDAPDLGSDPAILVFSVTAGWRHEYIPTGNEAIRELAQGLAEGSDDVDEVTVDVIDDPDGDASAFPTDAGELARYDAVVWNSTTGDVLDDEQQAAFEEYIRNGGGYAGIHAAADTEYDWDFYGDLVGAYFEDHPEIQEATVEVETRSRPSTAHLPESWTRTDEWYDYRSNPREDVNVLASLDESTYDNAGMEGTDHPIAWYRTYEGARSWYTGMGHTNESWEDEAFRQHVLGGISWAAGYVDGEAAPETDWSDYTKTPLDTETGSPVMLDVADDGRVFYIEFGANFLSDTIEGTGEVVVIHPDSGETETVLEVPVFTGHEDGMLGITLDPDFADNGWVYLYYSPSNEAIADTEEALQELNAAAQADEINTPPSESVADPYNLLSRFTMEDGTIDPDSEVELLKVPTQREVCCHTGGDMHWGPDGENLYLTTGDDTNPFQSDGYAPMDEREGRAYFDAQRTSADTSDLRGKILRIAPQDDGSYTVPEGNLFTEERGCGGLIDDGLVKPEIYTMGNRNPYRAAVDDDGTLYWGDYGPDAGEWSADRGPMGTVEFNWTDEAGNYGWPYFTGPNNAYIDGEFEDADNDKGYVFDSSGEPFDPANPVNDSPNNGGLERLPASTGADVFYTHSWDAYLDAPDYADVADEAPYPDLTGGAPMAGPVYRHREDFGDLALPDAYEGRFFIMEWGQNWIKTVTLDGDGGVERIDPFMPDTEFLMPQDMKVGPDGALYLVEWGEGYGGENSGIYRIEHDAGSEDGSDDGSGDSEETVSAPFGYDAGGGQLDGTVTIDGLEFVADSPAVTATGESSASGNGTDVASASTSDPIGGTEHDALYRTEQYGGNLSYDVAIENGTYDVTLHLVEMYWGDPANGGGEGSRVLDVSVEGQQVASDLDIYAEVGHDVAMTRTVEGVEVTDGVLDIDTRTSADNTSIVGFEIRPAEE